MGTQYSSSVSDNSMETIFFTTINILNGDVIGEKNHFYPGKCYSNNVDRFDGLIKTKIIRRNEQFICI